MKLILGSLLLLFSVVLSAQIPKNKNIEFCQESVEKDGVRFSLGHSLFSVGETHRKTLLNYQSKFSRPITHTFTFSEPIQEKLWLGCNYGAEGNAFIEYVEVTTRPWRCVETMFADEPNRVQYFKCESKKQEHPKTPAS